MPLDVAAASSPMNDDVARLIATRNLIETPDTWIKRAYVYKGNGKTQYCLVGALSRACGSFCFHIPNRTERRLINLLVKELGIPGRLMYTARHCLKMYNDASQVSHRHILALIDRSIARLLHVPTLDLARDERLQNYVKVKEWVA